MEMTMEFHYGENYGKQLWTTMALATEVHYGEPLWTTTMGKRNGTCYEIQLLENN